MLSSSAQMSSSSAVEIPRITGIQSEEKKKGGSGFFEIKLGNDSAIQDKYSKEDLLHQYRQAFVNKLNNSIEETKLQLKEHDAKFSKDIQDKCNPLKEVLLDFTKSALKLTDHFLYISKGSIETIEINLPLNENKQEYVTQIIQPLNDKYHQDLDKLVTEALTTEKIRIHARKNISKEDSEQKKQFDENEEKYLAEVTEKIRKKAAEIKLLTSLNTNCKTYHLSIIEAYKSYLPMHKENIEEMRRFSKVKEKITTEGAIKNEELRIRIKLLKELREKLLAQDLKDYKFIENYLIKIEGYIKDQSNTVDTDGNTLLHYACAFGLYDLAVALNRNNEKFDVKNKDQCYPFHLILQLSNDKLTNKFLVLLNPSFKQFNERSNEKNVFEMAALYGNLPGLEWLIRKTKQENIKFNFKKLYLSLLKISFERNHWNIVNFLIKELRAWREFPFGDLQRYCTIAHMEGRPEMAKVFFKHGIYLAAEDWLALQLQAQKNGKSQAISDCVEGVQSYFNRQMKDIHSLVEFPLTEQSGQVDQNITNFFYRARSKSNNLLDPTDQVADQQIRKGSRD